MRYIRITSCAAIALVLAACSGQAAAPTPAPTATVAPTATPRPTNTPLPPTATPAPPTAAPASAGDAEGAESVIKASFEQVRAASSYRMELEVTSPAIASAGAAGGASNLVSASGQVAGMDSQITMTGVFAQLLGANPSTGIELITAGGRNYVRGPVPLLGAAESGWYELPADGSSPASAVQPGAVVGMLGPDSDVSGFRAADKEQLNGQQCQVYVGDKDATMAVLKQLSSQGLPGPQSARDVQRAEMRFWVCDDGYLHRMTLETEGVQQGQSVPFGYSLNLLLRDFGADVNITVPTDAKAVTPPSFGLPTPTP